METRPEHPAEPHPIVPTPSHPALNAMLICDVAFQDEASGKTSLIGVFETVTAFQFPARHGRLCVYAKLTDAQGEYRLRLELVRLEELKVVGRGQLGATFADRMTAISYGKEKPSCTEHNEACWSKNRRDDLNVLK